MIRALYICYFGVDEPLVRTQVLPYLRELQKEGEVEVSLLTFEPSKPARSLDEVRAELAKQGIDWHHLRYHKRPTVPATVFDVVCGALRIRRLIAEKRIDILHSRIHVPGLMAALARKFSSSQPKILFDIRGFFPEEYVDAGIWKSGGLIYRAVKAVESWLLRESDGFVVLTEKARDILFPKSDETGIDYLGRPVEVIPCCVDFNRFETRHGEVRLESRKRLGLDGRKVAAYVGSFGGWYLTDEMIDFFARAKERDPSSFAMILTQNDSGDISRLLKEKGLEDSDFLVRRVHPDEVHQYLSAADFAISFIKPCFSKLSSSPTKIAEYLASGLPVVANKGVGDTSEQVEGDSTGVMIEDFGPTSLETAFARLEKLLAEGPQLASRCRESAEKRFSLQDIGGVRYRRLYRKLSEGDAR